MLKQILKQFNRTQSIRNFSTSKQRNSKVAVCGAAGGIGQPMSLLLKMNPLVSELALYDLVNTPGIAADLSHIDVQSKVTAYLNPEKLCEAVRGAQVVIIPAGVPRKPGMTRDDLFNVNACIIRDVVTVIASECPKACIAVITNPVNSCVPVAAEILKENNCYDPKRLFGVSALDLVRARTFLGEAMSMDPQAIKVPVIGGHSGVTILPIISQCQPCFTGDQETIEKLTERIRDAGTEVVKAKAGAGSATLSMAYSGAKFANSLLRALNGECNVVECAYVESDVTEAAFFANDILLGTDGIEKNLGLPPMNDYEQKLFDEAVPTLKKNIELGVEFAKGGK